MQKVIITAAICGAEVTKEHNPNVPYTIEEIQREAKLAYEAGASIIHLHVREDDGTPTQDINRFRECIEAIKEVCPDVIVQPFVNINRADWYIIQELPYLSRAQAKKVVWMRKHNGWYSSLDDFFKKNSIFEEEHKRTLSKIIKIK